MVVAEFVAAARDNAAAVHGPFPEVTAAACAVEVVVAHANGGAVALPRGDPLVDALDLGRRLSVAGARLLRPDEREWTERLPDAAVGVTSAVVAVAETGSMALCPRPGAPRATSLLPTVHVCLLPTDDVVPDLASALGRLARDALPGVIVWVGGPSRTSDLEMIPTIGVHGPKTVEIVLVD